MTRAADRSVAVAALSGTSIPGTPPNSSNARICPSCQERRVISVKPWAQNRSENGRHTTSTYTLLLAPVSRSVTAAVSPAQSMNALAPGSCRKCLTAPSLSASSENISQNVWYEYAINPAEAAWMQYSIQNIFTVSRRSRLRRSTNGPITGFR